MTGWSWRREIVDIGIFVAVEDRGPHGRQKTTERSERVIDSAGLVSAMHHTVRALGIAALCPVVLPSRFANQFLEAISVSVLQKITGFLPAKDVVGGHTPRRAMVFAPTHQKLEKQRAHIELPLLAAIAEDLPE